MTKKHAFIFLAGLTMNLVYLSCIKPGDGVGLDENGAVAQVNPCLTDSNYPGCRPVDPCKLDSTAKGCPDDPCVKDPTQAQCQVATDSCNVAAGTQKPVSCLDSAYFVANVLPIFTVNCIKCHNPSGTAKTTLLYLDAASAWDSLVNHPAHELKTMMRVRPGMPESSYIYLKLTKPPLKYPYNTVMPYLAPPLPDAQKAIIQTWITGKK